MKERLRIAVSGLAATYPFGGVFWDYVQYLYGFHRMGHDVLYIEDTGKWCYDSVAQTFVESGENNAAYLASHLARLDPALADRWFYRDGTGCTYGRNAAAVAEFCRSADLFLHISASCCMRDEYFAPRTVAFLDSDPMYTQASVPGYLEGTLDDAAKARVEMLRAHDVFFTFGENLGAEDCRIPTGLFDWVTTRQPIVIDCFAGHVVPVNQRRPVFTTVASWEPTEKGPVVNGIAYAAKSVEFERFIDLPKRVDVTLELALSGRPPGDRLLQHGWKLLDAYQVSSDPWVYRDYLAHSMGEWSVAKNAYVASGSGWFSCRSACYLALGVPVIVQQTRLAADLPTGRGLLTFDSIDEAVAAIDAIASAPDIHAAAACEIARECFDATKVLGALLERAGGNVANAVRSSSVTV